MVNDRDELERLRRGAECGKPDCQKTLVDYYIEQYKAKMAEANEIYSQLMERAKKDDLFAMLEIANGYREGIFLEQSEEKYREWLGRIVTAGRPIYQELKYLRDSENIWGQNDRFHQEELFLLIYPLGDAAYALGLSLLGSSDIGELEKALYYFDVADQCLIPCEQYMDQIKGRIEAFSRRDEASTTVEQPEDIAVVEEIDQLKEEFGEEIWNRLASESRKYLVTALYCYRQISGLGNGSKGTLDYSAVILPMMKALELELKKRFYDGYIGYLKSRFDIPQAYMQAIGISTARERDAILVVRSGQVDFADVQTSEKFTLGRFRYCMGVVNFQPRNGFYCDRPVIDYVENTLLNLEVFHEGAHSSDSLDSSVDTWLRELIDEVEILRPKRNNSAHSGVVLMESDAEFCLQEIITIRKIIRNLVRVCK